MITIDCEDVKSSMVTAGATATTTEGNSSASRESGLLCSHSHGESIAMHVYLYPDLENRMDRYMSSAPARLRERKMRIEKVLRHGRIPRVIIQIITVYLYLHLDLDIS